MAGTVPDASRGLKLNSTRDGGIMNVVLRDHTEYVPKNRRYYLIKNVTYNRTPFLRAIDWTVFAVWLVCFVASCGILGMAACAVVRAIR
jgi:hypothetical protein